MTETVGESPPEGGGGSPVIQTSITAFAKDKSGGLTYVGARSRKTSAGQDVGLHWARPEGSVVMSELV